MKLFFKISLVLFLCLLSYSCIPQREMLINAGIDYAFDELQKKHSGGTIKAKLPKSSEDWYKTPWGFMSYRVIIQKDTASLFDSIYVPYYINYPVLKDTAKSFIKKLLKKKQKSMKDNPTSALLNTKHWLLTPDFFERVAPVVLSRISQDKPIANLFFDDDEDEIDSGTIEESEKGNIKIIKIRGTMSPRGTYSAKGNKDIIQEIREAESDNQIEAIVFDIDSNGGSAEGIQELYNAVYDCKKLTVAIANNKMLSAAYYAFCGADRIYINTSESSFAGSIGVYSVHQDWSRYNQQVGITYTYITSEKSTEKIIGNPDEPLSQEDFAFIQQEANIIHEAFIRDVNRARARNTGLDPSVFTGKSFFGFECVQNGLCDAIGTLDQAILYAQNTIMRRRLNTTV